MDAKRRPTTNKSNYKMIKLGLVGCGGIGSWFVDRLDWLIDKKQLDAEVHAYDDDIVELKDTLYQKFDKAHDLHDSKVMALDTRYDVEDERWFFGHENRILDSAIFKEFDIVISAVDNLLFRKLMYEECECPWIDLRAEGRTIMVVTKHKSNTPDILDSFIDGNLEENGSCQLQADLEAGRIQLGYQIVANIGAQLLLNWSRGIPLPPKYIHLF